MKTKKPTYSNNRVDAIVEEFAKRYADEGGWVDGLLFWPVDDVVKCFEAAAEGLEGAKTEGEENKVLKTFYDKMTRFFSLSSESSMEALEEKPLAVLAMAGEERP